MKHCHFSILWNEIAFLKQKLPFLYKHFDQIIFYDLNIKTHKFSDDGSHEYIKNFHDPEKKITLIEKTNLNDVTKFYGHSFGDKRKMFAVGSKLVKDSIDVFWCTDMDEFFHESLIHKVEQVISNSDACVVNVNHLVFFKNTNFVFSTQDKAGEVWKWPWSRIARHKKGNIYGHCNIGEQFGPARTVSDELIFHFSYIGNKKVNFKCGLYSQGAYLKNIWNTFNTNINIKDDEVYGYPKMHPTVKFGIKKNKHVLPQYINVSEMLKGLS